MSMSQSCPKRVNKNPKKGMTLFLSFVQTAITRAVFEWCRGRESNSYAAFAAQDFKSYSQFKKSLLISNNSKSYPQLRVLFTLGFHWTKKAAFEVPCVPRAARTARCA